MISQQVSHAARKSLLVTVPLAFNNRRFSSVRSVTILAGGEGRLLGAGTLGAV